MCVRGLCQWVSLVWAPTTRRLWMTQEMPGLTAGNAPLPVLLSVIEEEVRLVAERLEATGALTDDPVAANLLAEARVQLLVAIDRVTE